MQNPYYDSFLAFVGMTADEYGDLLKKPWRERYRATQMSYEKTADWMAKNPGKSLLEMPIYDAYRNRREWVEQYAWAIPNLEAIQAIVKYSPIVEIASGTGYWAWLIRQEGGEILATDADPPAETWTDVLKKTELQVMHAHRKYNVNESSLMFCWPPYATDMAFNALSRYKGKTVIYIGEGEGGCTGCDQFHSLLSEKYEEKESVAIPQYDGIHDVLRIYQKIEAE